MSDAGDLPSDWWTTADVATYLEVKPSTVRRYVSKGFMPPPDRHMGERAPVWKPRTITKWNASRPRKGQADAD
jgi:predicted DNA-binding transcriptional regulator AlpA